MGAAVTTISPHAVVEDSVTIGRGVTIHPYVCIYRGVVIGDNCEINPGAFLGKEPKAPVRLIREPRFERRLTLGEGVLIGPHAVVYYDVEIGDLSLVGEGASIREQCRIGQRV